MRYFVIHKQGLNSPYVGFLIEIPWLGLGNKGIIYYGHTWRLTPLMPSVGVSSLSLGHACCVAFFCLR